MVIPLLPLALGLPAMADTCVTYAGRAEVATLDAVPELSESSGLAVSRTRGVLYTHEDSGGSTQIFAFLPDGTSRGAHGLVGAAAYDWEDLSLGPCHDDPSLDCLFIADIGDNARIRAMVQVFEVREPTVDGEDLTVIATWNVAYPDHPRDSEALMVHPISGRIYLATKDWEGHEEIFRFPAEPSAEGVTDTLELVAAFDLETDKDKLVTGADYDPQGERVVLRTYNSAIEWRADPCDPDAAWSGSYTVWPISGEGQGEAIAYDRETSDLLTTSEGTPMPLSRMVCLVPEEGDTACGLETGLPSQPADSEEPALEATEEGCGGCGGRGAGLLWLPLLLSLRRARRPGSS